MTQTTSHALENKYKKEAKKAEKETTSTNLEKLPDPTGWRLLVMPFQVKEKSEGGIIIAQETLDRARAAVQVGYVLKMGPLCYKDEERYPTGAWCKPKDWVIFARYAGSRMQIDGGEIRMLNDDEILGTIDDPKDLIHAM
jgi:co-chaperonin GroES (HSP10)|nr:GroS Co-chaperonin GroES [uncultured Mediterranean phage uvMED]|tara:strand:- start:25 stop:444 length:420 start_codon:yes stop_codon:yes gene_type:complete